MSGSPGKPLDGDAVASRFDLIFGPYRHVVLAVSGGADSMAMMLLAAKWRAARVQAQTAGPVPLFSVVTVDHGLRPESAAEAEAVQKIAMRFGFAHTTLAWAGEKPAAGIQAAARAARYRLLGEHLEGQGIEGLATAHTRDDQAETLLMRLARGSGVDGLAAMHERRQFGSAYLLRPMLTFSKADLIATLSAKGETWFEDPSNEKQQFERVRLRKQRPSFEAAGLTNEAIALSARRLGRARQALDEMAGRFLEQAQDALRIDNLGYAEFSWNWMLTQPEDIRLRLLARLVAAIGGSDQPVPMSGLEAMTEGRNWHSPAGHSLAGAVFSCSKDQDRILAMREFGRKDAPLPVLDLKSGQRRLWDHRFSVVNDIQPARVLRVRALGAEGAALVKSADKLAGRNPPVHPPAALYTIPSFWDGERLAAVPLLHYFEAGSPAPRVASYFSGWPASISGPVR